MPTVPAVAAELRVFFTRPDHPLAYGFSRLTQVLRRGGPLLELTPALQGGVVLCFGPPAKADMDGGEPAGGAADASSPSPGGSSGTPGAAPAGDPNAAPAIEVEDMGAVKAPSPAPDLPDGPAASLAGGGVPEIRS